MLKINRWFLGLFLAVLWPSALILSADEFGSDATSSKNNGSSPFEETTTGIDSAIVAAQREVRDPFAAPDFSNAPVVSTPVAGPAIAAELQGIGVGSKEAYAVIGGEVFYKGDEKKGIKLLEVRKREVDIQVNGGNVTVSLFPEQDLKKARARAKKMSALDNASVDQPSSLSGREQSPL